MKWGVLQGAPGVSLTSALRLTSHFKIKLIICGIIRANHVSTYWLREVVTQESVTQERAIKGLGKAQAGSDNCLVWELHSVGTEDGEAECGGILQAY